MTDGRPNAENSLATGAATVDREAMSLAETPEPPYLAVIFSTVASGDQNGYAKTAARMEELALRQEGFLGIDSAKGEIGITVSYWRDEAAIAAWRADAAHTMARETGRARWYDHYRLRVARVDRAHSWDRD